MSVSDALRDAIHACGVTQGEFAKAIGVSRLTVNQLLNEKRSITPDTALLIAKATDTEVKYWLELQLEYDLDRARTRQFKALKSVRVLR